MLVIAEADIANDVVTSAGLAAFDTHVWKLWEILDSSRLHFWYFFVTEPVWKYNKYLNLFSVKLILVYNIFN